MNLAQSFVFATAFVIGGCAEPSDEFDPARYLTESGIIENWTTVEFPDHRSVKIECFKLVAGQQPELLAERDLEARGDGLGATLYISTDTRLEFTGDGLSRFEFEVDVSQLGKLNSSTRGRSASLRPSSIVWVGLYTQDPTPLAPDRFPTLPKKLEDLAYSIERPDVTAIALRAILSGSS